VVRQAQRAHAGLTLTAPGDGKNPDGADGRDRAAQLPIGQIVLFSSGVGYFQREGAVEGNARVDLSFPVQDINDLLKSMVVRDLDGGVVSTVSYDSNAPVEKTLRSFAVNLNGNPSFAGILSQARGEKVEVVLQQTNATQPGTLTGTVIGVETQHQPAGKDATVNVELLNLWWADGMRSLKLSEVQRVRFLNPVMDSEFKKALETLTLSHDTWHVPKKELVSTLQVLMQAGRLTIANLPERETLVQELLAFRVKVTVSANETFEAWRERDHDDLVLAVALAAWAGEKFGPEEVGRPFAFGDDWAIWGGY
jgi:hypothetical protein